MRSTLKKTSFYLVLGFLPLASNFLLAPLFTRFLNPVEYGLIALASLFQNYLNVVIDLGLKGSFSRYYFRYFKQPQIVRSLLSTVILFTLGVAAVIFIFFFFFGDWIFGLIFKNKLFTFEQYGQFVCVLALTALLNSVILTYYRNEENLKKYAFVSLGTFFMMMIGAIIGVVVYRYGAQGNILGKTAGGVLVVSVFLIGFFFRSGFRFEVRLVKPLLAYGLPLIPFGLLNITINNLDRFFIERYFDLSMLGQYNIAFLISTIPFILLNSFQSSVNPGVIKLLETSKGENKASNYHEINSNFKVMLLFMCVVLWSMLTFSGLFIMFYVGEEYRSIIEYLPILMLAFIPMIYQNMYGILLFYHYESKLLPWLSIVTLVSAIALNVALIPIIGIYGVALAVLGKNLLFAYSTYWVVKKRGYYEQEIFDLGKYQWLSVALGVAAVLALALVHLFPFHYQYATLAAGGLAGVFIFTLFKGEFLQVIAFVRSKLRF